MEGLRYDIRVGTDVILQLLPGEEDSFTAYLSDVVRTPQLLWIFLFFCLITLAVGLWRGAASLIGLMVTAAVLFGGILPLILAGKDPILVTVIGSIVIHVPLDRVRAGVAEREIGLARGFVTVGRVAAPAARRKMTELAVGTEHQRGLLVIGRKT